MGEGFHSLGRRNTRTQLRIVHPGAHMRGYSSGCSAGVGGIIHALRNPDSRRKGRASVWLPRQSGTCEGNMGVVQPGPRVAVGGQAAVVVVAATRRRTIVATPRF